MARDTEAHASAPGSGDRTGREAVAALFARRQQAYDNLDAATLAADYAEDAVIDSPFSGRHTKAQAAHNLHVVFSAFMDMKLVTEALIVDGDRVAQVATIEGTNIGGLFGIDPSGKKFKISAVFVYELRDGLIVRERRVYDFTGVLVQVGVLKAKPA